MMWTKKFLLAAVLAIITFNRAEAVYFTNKEWGEIESNIKNFFPEGGRQKEVIAKECVRLRNVIEKMPCVDEDVVKPAIVALYLRIYGKELKKQVSCMEVSADTKVSPKGIGKLFKKAIKLAIFHSGAISKFVDNFYEKCRESATKAIAEEMVETWKLEGSSSDGVVIDRVVNMAMAKQGFDGKAEDFARRFNVFSSLPVLRLFWNYSSCGAPEEKNAANTICNKIGKNLKEFCKKYVYVTIASLESDFSDKSTK
ncbi:hypothetical protein [Candidatus Hydrogenosomobacter endosymbioticus]|uniref:Uncharacterized protein n=1 Tax=Candidatus Hydrogenosomobacter endosymbioticus TaxID=2558174 RepID=A0ABN6L2U1_9PROT|nr:hypothetical protein [Candidatus Hydrogenosomobacter endosymbioticus]BDB96190.1 hypothetical protein HYD_3230 [Candidatus Hydrogenosomobacter endosymbioticus]